MAVSDEIQGYVRERTPSDVWCASRHAPEGFRVVIVDEMQRPGSGWVALPDPKPCRATIDAAHHSCKRPGRFGFLRRGGRRRYAWAYCDDHLFGRHADGRRLLSAILAPERPS